MSVNEQMWAFAQQQLGYSDEEMKLFRENPRNAEVLSKVPELMNKQIVVEVVQAHGCLSGHKKGDKLCLDGTGNLLTKACPDRVCAGALNAIGAPVFTALELTLAGVDPNEMKFNRVGCPDVGLQCGGFGRIVMEVRVEDRVP